LRCNATPQIQPHRNESQHPHRDNTLKLMPELSNCPDNMANHRSTTKEPLAHAHEHMFEHTVNYNDNCNSIF